MISRKTTSGSASVVSNSNSPKALVLLRWKSCRSSGPSWPPGPLAEAGETASVLARPESPVLLMSSNTLPGREISEILGLVQGHTVFAVWLGKDLSAIVRLILGGELTEYTEMVGSARTTATERMSAKAAKIGADAVINVRYMTTSVIGSAAELLVYGTAVKLS